MIIFPFFCIAVFIIVLLIASAISISKEKHTLMSISLTVLPRDTLFKCISFFFWNCITCCLRYVSYVLQNNINQVRHCRCSSVPAILFYKSNTYPFLYEIFLGYNIYDRYIVYTCLYLWLVVDFQRWRIRLKY